MIHCRTICFAVLMLASATRIVWGQRAATPRERLDAHTQASALASDLVTAIFDVQLRHLEENGLAELPIYAEIRTSRDKIEHLASSDMQELTRLLEALQADSGEGRDELLARARVAARQIAVAMMAERQRLRGRLRTSRATILLR
ncbi:MAG: hypothetical protein ABI614_15570, partial [Planctomycetota bacterium]